VLSTKASIAGGDKNATPGVVTGGAWSVANGDWLRIDVDAAGTGAMGLAVMVGLTPSPIGSVTVAGAKGDPGGVTAWEGPWVTSTVYTIGQAVSQGGSSYVAITDHTSAALTQPGVGANWETAWMLLAGGEQLKTSVIGFALSSEYVIDIGLKNPIPIYFACTIVEATILGDVAGSAVVDLWKDTYGNYPPVNADSITGAAPLTLASQNKNTDTSLTGWTTSLAAGDVIIPNVDSLSLLRRITVALKVNRT
jgi:hypothetical protein